MNKRHLASHPNMLDKFIPSVSPSYIFKLSWWENWSIIKKKITITFILLGSAYFQMFIGYQNPLPISFPCQIFQLQFSLVTQSCPTLCDPMDCSTSGLPVHHQFPEFTQTHVHWVGDAIQPSHHLSSPSPPSFNISQHRCLFKWVSSSHQVAKALEFQLQHQSFQWTFRTDLL